jgi:hypothetical protein
VTDESGTICTVNNQGTVSVFGMSLATLAVQLPNHVSGTIQAEVDVFTSLGLAYTQTFQEDLGDRCGGGSWYH